MSVTFVGLLGVAWLGLAARPAGAEGPKADLDASVTATLKGGASARHGSLALKLGFTTRAAGEQRYSTAEYRYELFDRAGRQVEVGGRKAAFVSYSLRRYVRLKDGGGDEPPPVVVTKGALRAGEEYYVVVSVRNLSALVRFRATE